MLAVATREWQEELAKEPGLELGMQALDGLNRANLPGVLCANPPRCGVGIQVGGVASRG